LRVVGVSGDADALWVVLAHRSDEEDKRDQAEDQGGLGDVAWSSGANNAPQENVYTVMAISTVTHPHAELGFEQRWCE
jgi:hypothetical protein